MKINNKNVIIKKIFNSYNYNQMNKGLYTPFQAKLQIEKPTNNFWVQLALDFSKREAIKVIKPKTNENTIKFGNTIEIKWEEIIILFNVLKSEIWENKWRINLTIWDKDYDFSITYEIEIDGKKASWNEENYTLKMSIENNYIEFSKEDFKKIKQFIYSNIINNPEHNKFLKNQVL